MGTTIAFANVDHRARSLKRELGAHNRFPHSEASLPRVSCFIFGRIPVDGRHAEDSRGQQSRVSIAVQLGSLPSTGFAALSRRLGDWCGRLSGAGGQTVWAFVGWARRCRSRDGWRAHKWAVEDGIGCT